MCVGVFVGIGVVSGAGVGGGGGGGGGGGVVVGGARRFCNGALFVFGPAKMLPPAFSEGGWG